MLTSDDVRRTYVDFYTRRGHVEIPGTSLIRRPLGAVHHRRDAAAGAVLLRRAAPDGQAARRTCSAACARSTSTRSATRRHLTCFEMLGNWSLGDYCKRESLAWTLELLRRRARARLRAAGVTVFPGDDECVRRWVAAGRADRERDLGARGQLVGPARPVRPLRPGLRDLLIRRRGWSSSATTSSSSTSRASDGTLRPLPQHNVDVGHGAGADRLSLQGVSSVYETDLFRDTLRRVRALSSTPDTRAERIVSDHVRSSVLLAGDGVRPSNSAHGYVLRRLLRRAIRQGRVLGIDGPFVREVGRTVLDDRACSTCWRPRSAGSRGRCGAGCASSSGSRTSTAASSSGSSRPTGCRPS